MAFASESRKNIMRLLVVGWLAACMMAAQLSTQQHSINHPFHKHTPLCDSFLDFDHGNHSLTHNVSLLLSFAIVATSYAADTQAAFHSDTGTFRIRGPPSLLV